MERILLPAGTPTKIVAKKHVAVVNILAMSNVKTSLNSLGAEVVGNTLKEFGSYTKSKMAKWGKVIKTSGASVNEPGKCNFRKSALFAARPRRS